LGYRIISDIAAIGENITVANPRSHHLSDFRYPTINPAMRSKSVVGNIERFLIAVAIIGKSGAS